jgi:hypothetical protein
MVRPFTPLDVLAARLRHYSLSVDPHQPKKPGPRPATGRSFVVIVVIAAALAIGVTAWRMYSLSKIARGRGGPAGFRI